MHIVIFFTLNIRKIKMLIIVNALTTAGSSGRSPIPLPLEGVAEGQGRDTRISRQANACHKEF